MTLSSDGTPAGTGLRRLLRESPALRTVLLVVVSVLLAAALVLLVAEVLARRDGGVASTASAGDVASAAQEREKVMEVAGEFADRTFTYGPADLEDGRLGAYEQRVKELLTTSFATEFEEFLEAPLTYVKETQRDQTAEVYGTGVVSLTDDRAQALVAGAYETTWYSGTTREVTEDPIQFRWAVDLVEVEGEWRVDKFTPVSAAPGAGEGRAP